MNNNINKEKKNKNKNTHKFRESAGYNSYIGYVDKYSEILKKFSAVVICVLMLLVMLFLTAVSFVQTCDMNMNNSASENIDYNYDNFLLNIVALIIGIVLLYIIKKITPRINPIWFTLGLVLWVSLIGVIWINSSQSAPTCDSLTVSQAAFKAMNGDYSAIDTDYFRYYPFQLGYVLFSEIILKIYSLFSAKEMYIVIEMVNVACLAVSYLAIMKITKYIFKSNTASIFTAVLLACSLPPVFFCTFTYGNIPGFMFAMLALWMMLAFFEKPKWYFGILSALFIGFSVAIKLNYIIVFVAMFIVWVLHLLRSRKVISLVCIVMSCVCVFGIKQLILDSYEKRAGIELGSGIPMISWMAMGLNDSVRAPGWYSGEFTVSNFNASSRDADVASEKSKGEIKERLDYFDEDKVARNEFFYKKNVSQWNEPTYQSIWNSAVRARYSEIGKIANYVCNSGQQDVKQYINLHQQLIFFGMCLALLFNIKTKDINSSVLPLIILGGFIYHTLFEAKSQYIIIYFMLMIPYAAYGFDKFLEKADEILMRKFNKNREVLK